MYSYTQCHEYVHSGSLKLKRYGYIGLTSARTIDVQTSSLVSMNTNVFFSIFNICISITLFLFSGRNLAWLSTFALTKNITEISS